MNWTLSHVISVYTRTACLNRQTTQHVSINTIKEPADNKETREFTVKWTVYSCKEMVHWKCKFKLEQS